MSLKNFSGFVESEIRRLNLKNYVIAGISFGFRIISEMKLEKNCKAIIAISPFTDIKSLDVSTLKKFGYLFPSKLILFFGLSNFLWRKGFFLSLGVFKGKSKWQLDAIFNQIHPETFFRTIKILLEEDFKPEFHDIPHVLLLGKNDGRIKYRYTVDMFRKNVKNLLIINTDMEHFPKILTKNYFSRKVTKENIEEIMKFLDY